MLKISRVTAIFTKGNPGSPDNYRPMSIIPLGKIIEVTLKNRLKRFFENHQLINKNQYAFRKNVFYI